MSDAVQKKLDAMQNGFQPCSKDKKIALQSAEKNGEQLVMNFDSPATAEQARAAILSERGATDYGLSNGNSISVPV